MFHAQTGCDIVSAFVGHSKKTAWVAWNAFPELTSALLELAHAPTAISKQATHIIERFVYYKYGKTI